MPDSMDLQTVYLVKQSRFCLLSITNSIKDLKVLYINICEASVLTKIEI